MVTVPNWTVDGETSIRGVIPDPVAFRVTVGVSVSFVLTVMVVLLVVGLGWCFYRAVKAAGAGPEEAQLPEDDESA